MARDRLVFYTKGGFAGAGAAVGKFCGRAYPTAPGRVQYDPYRGPGYAQLKVILAEGRAARCYFFQGGHQIDFDVACEDFVAGDQGCRSHWYLDISSIARAAVGD